MKKFLMTAAMVVAMFLSVILAQAPSETPNRGRAGGRGQRPTADTYATPRPYPDENKAAVSEIISRARKIAGPDLFRDFTHRCILSPRYSERVSGIQYNGLLEPTKMFDQLYYVGQVAVSAHALVTSAGIVLFDSLNNEDEAKNIIVPNLVKLGLDPKNLRFIVLSHEHGDHYGGARYLQKTYGAKVISSKVGWDAMDRSRNQASGPFAGPPDRDVVVDDGQAFPVGETTVRFYVTPGHTNGTLSMIFPVTFNGTKHVVGYQGGTGGGRTPDAARAGIKSMPRWLEVTKAAGVDVLIANHPEHDHAIEKNEILQTLKKGDPIPT
jgi:metallo-beta-lactamase class B